MLAGLLDAVDRDVDLVILDRGIFDALIWLELQDREGQVSPAERDAFEAFVTLDRWRQLIDAVYLLKVSHAVAMQRENQNRLLPRSGSVMQPKRLRAFNKALVDVRERHTVHFRFTSIPNTNGAREGARTMISTLLTQARSWCDPRIAVISKRDARTIVPDRIRPWSETAWKELSALVVYRRRSLVERDDGWVQPIAGGAQTFGGQVFLAVRRRARDDVVRSRDDTAMIWRGCHVPQPLKGKLDVAYLKRALLSRLKQDLHLGELDANPRPLGLVWDPHGEEPRHLGIMFQVPVSAKVANFLDERQFKTNGRGYRVENSFVRPAQLGHDEGERRGYTLEEWSRLIHEAKWLSKT
jgi:hypothetical protein